MREAIIQSIKNTFGLDETKSIGDIDASKINTMVGFPELVAALLDEETIPHDLAGALEVVIVNIKLQATPSAYARRFHDQIKILIDEPLYAGSANFGSLSKI